MAKVFAFQEYNVGNGIWSDLYELDDYNGSIYLKETEIEYKEIIQVEFSLPVLKDGETIKVDLVLDENHNTVSVTPNPDGKNEIYVDTVYGEIDADKRIREYLYIGNDTFTYKLSEKQHSKKSKVRYD